MAARREIVVADLELLLDFFDPARDDSPRIGAPLARKEY
jgi:hypothetical protein